MKPGIRLIAKQCLNIAYITLMLFSCAANAEQPWIKAESEIPYAYIGNHYQIENKTITGKILENYPSKGAIYVQVISGDIPIGTFIRISTPLNMTAFQLNNTYRLLVKSVKDNDSYTFVDVVNPGNPNPPSNTLTVKGKVTSMQTLGNCPCPANALCAPCLVPAGTSKLSVNVIEGDLPAGSNLSFLISKNVKITQEGVYTFYIQKNEATAHYYLDSYQAN